MNSRCHSISSRRAQRGAATLIMVLAVLVLLTVITVMSGRIATVEQRTAANELRARQALEAAMTGFEMAVAHANDPVGVPLDAAPLRNPRAAAPGGGTYAVEFCDLEINNLGRLLRPLPNDPILPCVGPGANSKYLIYARGWSDDGTGVHHVLAIGENAPAFPGTPQNPLTARGSAIINGSGDVTNPYGRTTIWSGHPAVFTNANFKTNILSPDGLGIIESSSSRQAGVDVIDGDSRLSRLGGDSFFKNFMGFSRAEYPAAVGATKVTDLDSMAGSASYNTIIWGADPTPNDGSMYEFDVSGNPEFGYKGDGTLNDPNQPAVVIIDGDFDVSGTVTVNGLLYVRGDLTGNGNLSVNGAVIVEGSVNNMTGSVDVIYDPNLLGAARGLGRAAPIPGSWKDWLSPTDV